MNGKYRKSFAAAGIIVLIILIFLLIFLAVRCSQENSSETSPTGSPDIKTTDTGADNGLEDKNPGVTPAQDFEAEIINPSEVERAEYAVSDLPQSDCYMGATLFIADGPGRPEQSGSEKLQVEALINRKTLSAISVGSIMPIWPIEPINPILPIEPINPNPTPLPSSDISILSPAAGEVLTAGSNYKVDWEVYSGRELVIDLLFSSDNGKTFVEIAADLPNDGFYLMTVPSDISSSCVIRLNAWIGTRFIGYNVSPVFSIVNPIKPSPTPSVSPKPAVTPTLTPTPPVKPSPSPAVSPAPTTVPETEPDPEPEQKYIDYNGSFISSEGDPLRWFKVEHDLADTDHMVWQAARTPFPCGYEAPLDKPPGLLAEGILPESTTEFSVDFKALVNRLQKNAVEAPDIENNGAGFEKISDLYLLPQSQYVLYIRVIILDKNQKIIGMTRSEFQVVYGEPTLSPAQAEAINTPSEIEVKSYVPSTSFQRYIPIEWPVNDYKEYFEVTRPIQAEEICFYIKNSKTGDFLYPYNVHMSMFPQTTREQYQATVDRMLPPGAWFHLTVNVSAWDKFWSDFFTLLSEIYNNVQQQYNGLKYSVANFIADRFEFMGEDFQDFTRSAVVGLIDYGLASVGLPPSLPNFEEMADQGLDYCVRIALEEAAQTSGIPVSDIPADTRKEIVNEVKSRLQDLTQQKNVNPLDVNYLKPAAKAMYRPAYVDVKIFNQHDRISPGGTLTMSYYPKGKPHFKLYNYVSLPIPTLKPGESTNIRVYLKPDNTDLPVWKEYYRGDIGECSFNFNVIYNVPDPKTTALQQGISGVENISPENFYYDINPVISYSKTAVPDEAFYNLYN
jgi:hypothetical protein